MHDSCTGFWCWCWGSLANPAHGKWTDAKRRFSVSWTDLARKTTLLLAERHYSTNTSPLLQLTLSSLLRALSQLPITMLARSCLRSARSVGPVARNAASKTASVRPIIPSSSSFDNAISSSNPSNWRSCWFNGFIASCLDVELRIRGSCLVVEDDGSRFRCNRLRHRIRGLVLSPLWPERRCYDTGGRRVSSLEYLGFGFGRGNDTGRLTLSADQILIRFSAFYRLHPTAYPWEHTKWTKTFDHQAWVTEC